MVLGFNWLQSINPQGDWVNYIATLKNGFVATGVPIHQTVSIELYSFKVLTYLLCANKLKNNCFAFDQQILGPQGLNSGILYY